MRRIACFGLLFLFLGASFDSPKLYYVNLPFNSKAQLRTLAEEGFDVGGVDYELNQISLVVPEEKLTRLHHRNVLSYREIERAPDTNFKSPEEVEDLILEAQRLYPHLVGVEVIGKSVEDRNIYAVHLGARFVSAPAGDKPTILFDAMHHSREIMTPEVALDIIDYLSSNYGKDEKVTEWMNLYSIWVVPMVNPDGNAKVWNSSSMWRKNTRGGYGVDINRNYDHKWNTCNGSSGNKNSDTYRGPSPASEPETQALMKLAARLKPVFNISYHSYSEIVIFPFGCSPQRIPEPDRTVYEGIGHELASKLVRDSGNGTYRAGTSYDLLYNVDGGSLDWMYAKHKIMSFVIEVNSSRQGFQPSFNQWRKVTIERQRAGWMYILDKMADPGIRP